MTAESTNEATALQAAAPQTGALALMTLQPEQYAAEVYQPFKTRLAAAIEAARSIEYDIATGKGLEVVTKARRTLMDIRIEANKQREERKAPIIKIGKLLESSYKAVEELVLPLETFFDGEIKAEEQRKENEKQAKIAAERLRIEGIQARIAVFGNLVLQAAGKGSVAIKDLIDQVEELDINEELYEEFVQQAIVAKDDAGAALEVAHKAAYDAEQAIEAARIQREKEDRQRAEETAKLEAQRAEQERIAAAQAAESKRLADIAAAQVAELERAQKEADDRIKAQVAAENARIQAVADAHAAEHAKAVAELEAQRAAFEAQQEAAAQAQAAVTKAIEDAARLELDHTEALAINAAMIPFPPATDDPEIESLADLVDSGAVADAVIMRALDTAEAEPTDEEIVTAYVSVFGGSVDRAVARLRCFVG